MSLTSPLVPAYVELADYTYMPLDVRRLLTSDTWILAGDEPLIGYALINLWCESWHQKPAASIPSNEVVLARMSNIARADWRKVCKEVLKSWTLCSDGRYYHRVVAEKALEAWLERIEYRREGMSGSVKRWGDRSEKLKKDMADYLMQQRECEILLYQLNPQSKWFKKHTPPITEPIGEGITPLTENANHASSHPQATHTPPTSHPVGGDWGANRGGITEGIGNNGAYSSENPVETSDSPVFAAPPNSPAESSSAWGGHTPPNGNPIASKVEASYCTEPEHPASVPVGIHVDSPGAAIDLQAEFDLAHSAAPIAPVVIFPLAGNKSYPIYPRDIDELSPLYPAVDVTAEARKMVGWLSARPRERKTERGIMKFVNSWLARAQDSSAHAKGSFGGRGGKLTEGKWSGFGEKDYDKGINADGSF